VTIGVGILGNLESLPSKTTADFVSYPHHLTARS